MNAEAIKNLFVNIEKESPKRWPAAVRTICVEIAETNEKLSKELAETKERLQKLIRVTSSLAVEVKALKSGKANGAVAAEPVVEPRVNGVTNGESVEGKPTVESTKAESTTPLTPEQEAAERMMDAAIAAEEEEKKAKAQASK